MSINKTLNKKLPHIILGQNSIYYLIFREERQNRKIAKLLREFSKRIFLILLFFFKKVNPVEDFRIVPLEAGLTENFEEILHSKISTGLALGENFGFFVGVFFQKTPAEILLRGKPHKNEYSIDPQRSKGEY